MFLKQLHPQDINHNIFSITKSRTLQQGDEQYDHFVSQSASPTYMQKSVIGRFIYNNYIIQRHDNDSIHLIDGSSLPKTMFSVEYGKVKLLYGQIYHITYFKNILTQDRIFLIDVESDGKNNQLQVYGDLIFQGQICIGVFIPHINCILWNQYIDYDYYVVSYDFKVHQFQYYCSINPNEFNITNNPSAYDSDGVQISKFTNTCITSIGLYGQNDQLLAIAKLSQPIKNSNIVPTNVIIQLDYIP